MRRVKNGWVCNLMAGLALLATSPAEAQNAGIEGNDAGHFPTFSKLVPRGVATGQVAQCTIGRSRDRAIAFLRAGFLSKDDQKKALKALRPTLSTCIKGLSFTMLGVELGGSLANYLLKENSSALLARAAAKPAVQPARIDRSDNLESRFAACLVSSDPANSAALLRSEPASPEETKVIGALSPAMQACVPASGALRLNPQMLRLWVAILLYSSLNETAGT